MEGHCSTGQSPQWAVVPMEEEEEEEGEEEKVFLMDDICPFYTLSFLQCYQNYISHHCKHS